MSVDDHLRINRRVYDSMVSAGDPLCRPASDDELADPLRTVDALGWLGSSIAGRRLLCLAAGGGRQSSLYAAAGAVVTVVDLSGGMLELDRRTAAERGFSLRLFEASMDNLSMLLDGEFDIVIHPVSSCYVPDIRRVFDEVARVSCQGAIYISQHKQPTSLQAEIQISPSGGYELKHRYYRDAKGGNEPIPSPPTSDRVTKRLREKGAIEYLHRWEQIIGGMCRSGFVIEDMREPFHAKESNESGAIQQGSFSHRASFIPPYVRIKARRVGKQSETASRTHSLWLPGADNSD